MRWRRGGKPSSVASIKGGEVAGEGGELETTIYQGVVAYEVSPASEGRAPDTSRKATLADFIPSNVTPDCGILAKIVQQL